MADNDHNIGSIGGGTAGLTVTSATAQFGAKTLLTEKAKEPVGASITAE